ncbi:MAG: chorismate synthase [Kiritimatiellae bacterium]|nr:chorismate synthase [Kiritimatiellia bacterium]
MAFHYLSAGESHGPCLSVIVEGVPAGLPLDAEMVAADLAKRQLKAGAGGRMAIETDRAEILAGVMQGVTTGAPIALQIVNKDHAAWKGKAVTAYTTARPGHADLAACAKYGFNDIRQALERSSARETACRVAVGAIARQFLAAFGIKARSYVASLGNVPAVAIDDETAFAFAETSPGRAPSQAQEDAYTNAIHIAKSQGETLGGVIELEVTGLPIGLGSYVTPERRLDARLAAAVMSVNAIKGLEIGEAFKGAATPGSQLHDAIVRDEAGQLVRPTNRCGGLEAGMTTGQPLRLRVAMKPIPTTIVPQKSVDLATGKPATTTYERSDTCPVPRACVVIESVVLIELAAALIEKLGGDSLNEMLPRYAALPKAAEVQLSAEPKVFWP